MIFQYLCKIVHWQNNTILTVSIAYQSQSHGWRVVEIGILFLYSSFNIKCKLKFHWNKISLFWFIEVVLLNILDWPKLYCGITKKNKRTTTVRKPVLHYMTVVISSIFMMPWWHLIFIWWPLCYYIATVWYFCPMIYAYRCKIIEANLFIFVYRLFHEAFTPLIRTNYIWFFNSFYAHSGRAVLTETHSFLLTQPWFTCHRLGDGVHGSRLLSHNKYFLLCLQLVACSFLWLRLANSGLNII